tara:strand:- start:7363 stop:9840 length:2478 start_codon:yes stop_codon:yes gene_type:complete
MAKQPNNNIAIHFRAEGEQELKNAIISLANSTRSLKNAQAQLAKSTQGTTAAQQKQIASGQLAMRNQRNMNAAVTEGNMTFSVFRSKLLLASFAVGLLGNTVGRLVAAFAEQESSEKRIDAALASTGNISGLTGNQIRAMTAELENTGVIGDELNNKMASLLLTFTNIRGDAFERTMVAANNMAISISGGVPTFEQLRSTALQLGKALQDPAGQLGALSRSGFTFTGNQKEMIKNLVAQNKLFEAQTIILDAADTQFGGLNEAMVNTAEGAFAQMGNAAGSLAEDIGEVLAPQAIEFAHNMTELFKTLSANRREIVVLTKTAIDLAAAFAIYRTALALANKQSKLNIILMSMMNPKFAAQALVTGALAISFFKLNDAITDNIEDGEDVNNVLDKMKGQQQSVGQEVNETTKKIKKQTLELKIAKELSISNINIENAALLNLTEAEIKSFQEKKRTLLIQKELLKVDKDKREGIREETESYVDNVLAYENYIDRLRQHLETQKKINEETEIFDKIDKIIQESRKQELINLAKTEAVQGKVSEERLKEIEMLVELDKTLGRVGLGVQDFDKLLEDENLSMRDLIEKHDGMEDLYSQMIVSIGGALVTNEQFNESLEVFKKKLKALIEEDVDPFTKFAQNANIALQAFTNFSSAYGNLIDERMNREMEALRTTREFEEATQEQREIMENRIEQRFKSQRRRAFQIDKISKISQAGMDIASAYIKALDKGPAFAAFVAALGAAQLAVIQATPAPRFATGGSFITSGPRNIMVGESGAEKVTIQPLSGGTPDGSTRTQNVNISISAPLVDETILDVIIPKIKEAAELNLA